MKIPGFFFITFLSISGGLLAQNLTLDEVLNKYYEAANFEKFRQVKTIVMNGTLVQQDLMPVKIVRMRPDKYLMEYDVADMTAYQAYDGTNGWFTAPWTGKAAPQTATGDRATDLKNRADMDGVLYDWKAKGHSLELAGNDTVNGLLTYKIKVTRKDGGVEFNFVDHQDFLLRKRLSYRQAGGREITVENFYRDYRTVNGIPFAFTIETNSGGRINEIQFDTIEPDQPLDPNTFAPPTP
jgi:hypothetical protein